MQPAREVQAVDLGKNIEEGANAATNRWDITNSYPRFVREGVGRPSLWEHLRGQIFLGSESFLEEMERLSQSQRLDNFGVSPSRISHIQRAIETGELSGKARKLMLLCKVKQ